MKKLDVLKLNNLANKGLSSREMKEIRGGDCFSGCWYQNSGGSSYKANCLANSVHGYTSYGGDRYVCD